MIARCPECQTRYRIEAEKIGPNGARIRCSQCNAVFRVEPEAAPGEATQTLLVAEPDADVAKMVAGYLRRWQIATTVVHDGGQALLFLHREKPGAVIVGAGLAGLSGAEFAEIVRHTAEFAAVKLIRVVSDDEPSGSPLRQPVSTSTRDSSRNQRHARTATAAAPTSDPRSAPP